MMYVSQIMAPCDELDELRLQFQTLQKQQEKRKLDRKKEKEPDKLNVEVTQEDSGVLKQESQAEHRSADDK